MGMVREMLRQVLIFLFRTLTRLEVIGEENIPVSGGCLLASNHLSRLDPPLVFALLKRKDSTGLIADKYKEYPLFRWIIEGAQGIWLDRENPDIGALRAALKYLRTGGMIGIAPEGTRSPTGGLIPPKPGVAFLAVKANVPIVPIAIIGTEKTVQALIRFRRSPVRVIFCRPFSLPARRVVKPGCR
jgi:1-acyl-sn-glycerol-3-phosphate acyltransferase